MLWRDHVFLGALFWSLNSPLVKFLTLNALLICGLRSVIAAVALLPTIRPKQLRWNGWMLMYVCSYTGLCVSVILALSLTSAPVAVGMQYTATIWLFLLGLVQKKPFTLRAFFPVLVISLGVVCFMCSGTDGASQAGNLIALAEGVFFACLTVSSKRAAGTTPWALPPWPMRSPGCWYFSSSQCPVRSGRNDGGGVGDDAGAGRNPGGSGLWLL